MHTTLNQHLAHARARAELATRPPLSEAQAMYAAEVAAFGLLALLAPYTMARVPEQRRAS